MKKLCFYSPPFPRVKSYYDMIDIAADFGINAVEGLSILDFANPDLDVAKKIREYADSKNVIFPCLSVFIREIHENDNVERLKKYAEFAKILGSPYLHHTIIGEFSNPDNVIAKRDLLFKGGIDAVREVYDYAESIGIRTIYEEQGYIFNGLDGFGEFLNKVDRNVGVVADFANMYQAGDDAVRFISAFSDRVVHAHIKDVYIKEENDGRGLKTLDGKYMSEAQIGQGVVNMKEVIKLLDAAGFDGYYGIEYSAKEDNSPIISDTINYIESLF